MTHTGVRGSARETDTRKAVAQKVSMTGVKYQLPGSLVLGPPRSGRIRLYVHNAWLALHPFRLYPRPPQRPRRHLACTPSRRLKTRVGHPEILTHVFMLRAPK